MVLTKLLLFMFYLHCTVLGLVFVYFSRKKVVNFLRKLLSSVVLYVRDFGSHMERWQGFPSSIIFISRINLILIFNYINVFRNAFHCSVYAIFTIFDAISVGVVIVCLTAIPVVENFRKIPSLQIFRSAEEAADTRVSPFDGSLFTIFAVNL